MKHRLEAGHEGYARRGALGTLAITVAFCFAMVAVSPQRAFALERDDALPGVPIGVGTYTGVVDVQTDVQDVYALQLYAGAPVTFSVTVPTQSGGFRNVSMRMFAPAASSLQANEMFDETTFTWRYDGKATYTYTPAVSGVYYLEIYPANSSSVGAVYNLSVSGSASLPDQSTRWDVKAAPGYTLTPTYGKSTTLSAWLMPSFSTIGLPLCVSTVQSSPNGVDWSNVSTLQMPSGVGYLTGVTPLTATYYRFLFAGDAFYRASASRSVLVKPSHLLGTPVARLTMSRLKYYTVYGTLKPRHTAGTSPVRIYRWKKTATGSWKSYGYVTAKASNYYSFSKYARSIRLPYAGRWRLRALSPADGSHAAAWSGGYDYVTVK